MHKFAATCVKATDNIQAIGTITAQTAGLRRGKLCEVSFGISATPADAAFRCQVARCTTTGTGTTKVAEPIDPSDAAATSVVKTALTADPTLTATKELLDVAMNQRSTFRWVAAPDGELWWPGTNLAGLMMGWSAVMALAGTASGIFEE